jgi:hypothetical protein
LRESFAGDELEIAKRKARFRVFGPHRKKYFGDFSLECAASTMNCQAGREANRDIAPARGAINMGRRWRENNVRQSCAQPLHI